MMDAPPSLWIVLDSEGRPEFAAGWREAAHEHIKDAIEIEVDETASRWVVREYVPAAEITRLRAKNAALRDDLRHARGEFEKAWPDAQRWRYINDHNCEWRRFEADEPDPAYSMLCVRLPYGVDLSCKATRENAIDAAIAGQGERT